MKRWLAISLGLALCVGAAGAYAQESHRAAEGAEAGERAPEHKATVSDVVFGHVSDSHEMEFESPTGGEVRFELPRWEHAFGIPWLDLSITKHLVFFWVACLITLLVFALGKPRSLTPKGFSVLLEMMVLFVRDEVAKPAIGEPEYKKYTPYLCSAFFVILFCNLLGVLPYTSTPTGNIAVTAGLAICTFFVTQFASIKAAGVGGYLKHLSGGAPWWLIWMMVPIEIMGLFTKPFALCLRLFANMIAGHIVIFYLLALIFLFKSILIAPVSVALAVAIYLLEIFVALLQAYIFTILSAVFIGMGVAMGHHEGHHHAEHDAGVTP